MFEIDFFELSFLAEACIPPRPIARMTFWYRLIDEIYGKLTPAQRKNMYKWILRHPSFKADDPDCAWFADRYNPDNQYLVKIRAKWKQGDVRAFLREGRYYVGKDKWISEQVIKSVEKIIE